MMNEETFTVRIQYLKDTDPFECASLYPEPSRPPTYAFNIHVPLVNQISSVHRVSIIDITYRLSKFKFEPCIRENVDDE